MAESKHARTNDRFRYAVALCRIIAVDEYAGGQGAGESGLATDIAIRAIQDGRLGSDNLGSAMAVLLPSGLIKPGRWHKKLGEIARASSVHAAVVQLALQHCFEKPAKDLPKDFAKLLELLYELSLEIGLPVTNERCREWLVSGGVAGKAMKIAKSLLAIEANAASQEVLRGLLEQALELRIKAASSGRPIELAM